MNKFLVVRCSNIDGVNPVEEVNGVIARIGYCWFGKYGNPIAPLRKTATDGCYAVLAPPPAMRDGRALPVYRLTALTKQQPQNANEYPEYYEKIMHRIGSWLRLELAPQPLIDLDELTVKSSLQPLKHALNGSMRGHFWCFRKRNDNNFV
jgi:hypothetical protein